MPSEVGVPVQCFISYTRSDNEDFDLVVDKIKSNLSGRFQAATGRSLDIFLDRDSIGWGADWRAKIRSSVESATFFIPVVSARYFQSDMCREELLAFHESAKQLGVTALILPIILSGADLIRSDDVLEEVRLIEGLNYKDISAAWEQGYESTEWRQTISSMVRGLGEALIVVEAALAGHEESAEASSHEIDETGQESESEADASNLLLLMEQIQPDVEAATSAMQDFVATSTEALSMPANVSNVQRQTVMVRGARTISLSAQKFLEKALSLENTTLQLDAQLRGVLGELDAISGDMATTLSNQIREPLASFPDLTQGLESFDQIMQVLRVTAVTNVSLRKSLQPAIKASQSIRNAFETAESWRAL